MTTNRRRERGGARKEKKKTKKKKKATKGSTRKGGRGGIGKVGEKTDAPARVRTRSWTMDLRREENKVTSPYVRVCASTYGNEEEDKESYRV